ncbi:MULTISPECIES: NAD-dependent epimerase/dehydratase family protein [Xanthomonas]|uniref:Nucleoside-diphosphate-sugar epimerase n=1 Tax=Xanthomonas arboricola TaxID=56448 RepID=A0AB73GTE0_9XANT|nr:MULTISPECIES: NAD(P)-dependent oxidoreductase [Xanthomonas]MBB3796604.1 nucleoside-diphosphate-sugar epimerase [Xanthomonas arboricola]MBB4769528.1 nucleoside-diphosphate-sugar epimerase [Xanthomonas arboricola]MBB5669335.1 nucleoside-diphosphate-sugar epimerase [Xanthomonas arboricola]MXV45718.1 NAD(P)-dependent oxidoreductase [Xanthomonas sp. LMG 8993]QWN00017.1 NAD(P)H steroid dehydrogenase [Xanthomonas sp. MLO165]
MSLRILVTGASGFVGGSFLRRFQGQPGVEIHGIGRRASDLPNYHRIDLSQPFSLQWQPDVVIHAAALASPWGTRAQFQLHNVQATANVIDFCKRHGCPRLLYVSSSSVFYREEHQYDLSEDSPIGPAFVNTYAQTKYLGETLLQQYPGDKSVLRPRAVFGPGDTVLFPRVIAAARKGALPRFVGQTQPVIGDLIYIDTLCDYLYRAATAPQLQPAYNLTNAQPVDLQQLLLDLLTRLQLPLPQREVRIATALRMASVVEAAYRVLRLRGEPPITRFGVGAFAYSKTFDPRRTLADLGPPSVSLEQGIEAFVRWQAAQWA